MHRRSRERDIGRWVEVAVEAHSTDPDSPFDAEVCNFGGFRFFLFLLPLCPTPSVDSSRFGGIRIVERGAWGILSEYEAISATSELRSLAPLVRSMDADTGNVVRPDKRHGRSCVPRTDP